MNERIKQLANKAVGKRSCYMIEAEYIKFAELIVKECARVPINMWDKAELNADIAVKIEDRIRAEFGIPGVE